jgi:hypothetical protein
VRTAVFLRGSGQAASPVLVEKRAMGGSPENLCAAEESDSSISQVSRGALPVQRTLIWNCLSFLGSQIIPLTLLGLACGYYGILQALSDWRVFGLGKTVHLTRSSPLIWGVLGVWLSLLSCIPVLVGFLRLLCVSLSRFRLVTDQTEPLGSGGPPQKSAFHNLLFWVLFPPSLLGALLLVDEYTAVTEREFITNSPWSLGRESRYEFDRIEGVYEVQGFQGRLGPIWEVHHAIDFDDGQRWWSDRGSGGPKLEEQRAMVRSVAERSGLEMKLVRMRDDLPVRNHRSGR